MTFGFPSKYIEKRTSGRRFFFKKYISKNLDEFSENLKTDANLQNKIDDWIRVTAYKYILRNTHQFGNLISSTVGNWQGKELSEKTGTGSGERPSVHPGERNFSGRTGRTGYLYDCTFFL